MAVWLRHLSWLYVLWFCLLNGTLAAGNGKHRGSLPCAPTLRAMATQQSLTELPAKSGNQQTGAIISQLSGKLHLISVAMLYGIDYTLCKILQANFQPEVLSCLKYILATLFFLPHVMRCKIDAWSVRMGVELGLWCSVYALSVANAISHTAASTVSFYAALGVILPPIYDAIAGLFNRNDNIINGNKVEAVSRCRDGSSGAGSGRTWSKQCAQFILNSPFIAPILAICGVVMLESDAAEVVKVVVDASTAAGVTSVLGTAQSIGKSSGAGAGWSDLQMLIGPTCSSLCYWRSEKLAARRENNTIVTSTVMLSTVATICALYCMFMRGRSTRSTANVSPACVVSAVRNIYSDILSIIHSADGIGSLWQQLYGHMPVVWSRVKVVSMLFMSSVVVTGWNTLTEQTVLQTVSATQAYVMLSLEPLFATFFAWLLLGEHVNVNTVKAAMFIVSACMWGPATHWMQGKLKME